MTQPSPIQFAGDEPEERVKAMDILGAVARGWCHPINANKEFDPDLAIAISAEVNAILTKESP